MANSSAFQVSRHHGRFRVPAMLMASAMVVSSGASFSGPVAAGDFKGTLNGNGKVASARFLSLQEVRGIVTYKGAQTHAARRGDRLATGQGIATGKRSSAIIGLDSNLGTIKVAENTDLVVRKLSLENGGNITWVAVNRGQVALRVRPFTNPASRLEIRTPSGVVGVRGTEFGVAVSPTQRSAILTATGKVAVSAQAQTVVVKGGYSSLVYPGEAPTPPRPTVENVDLTVKAIKRYRSRLVRFEGQIDPINEVLYADQPIEVGRDGTFALQVFGSQGHSLTLVVRTPLGQEKTHTIWIP
jgi:FecR protein